MFLQLGGLQKDCPLVTATLSLLVGDGLAFAGNDLDEPEEFEGQTL